MNKLPIIIGPAPSELSLPIFLIKLSEERARVRKSLDEFRNRKSIPAFRAKKTPKAPKAPNLTSLLKTSGLNMNDLMKGLELIKKTQTETEKA